MTSQFSTKGLFMAQNKPDHLTVLGLSSYDEAEDNHPQQDAIIANRRALSSAWREFSTHISGVASGSAIMAAKYEYIKSPRARFMVHCATDTVDRILKNLFETAANQENRLRAEKVHAEDTATYEQAYRALAPYKQDAQKLTNALGAQFEKLKEEAGRYSRRPELLSDMENLTATLQQHSKCIVEALDMLRCPKKNDTQTYTPRI